MPLQTVTWSQQAKRDTALNWSTNNPVLLEGQLGVETDDLLTAPKFKIGDGVTDWNTLPYASSGSGSGTLQSVLLNGNSTGGKSITVNTNDAIEIGNGSRIIWDDPSLITSALNIQNVTGNNYISLSDNGTNYSGGNWDITGYELKAGQTTLEVNPTGIATVGTTQWNDTIGSSETTLKGGNVVLKNGVDLVARVVNKVTPAITLTKANYTVVKVSGAQGQRLAIDLAKADTDNNSADTLGLVIETISPNQEGFIMCVGQLNEINTTGSLQSETWADGDVLYLSPTVKGAITNVKPNGSTGHIVVIGYVEYAHAIHGSIYVKIMNGWELDELHNVYINPSTLANNDILAYESSTSLWKNKTVSSVLDANLTSWAGVTRASGFDTFTATPSSANLASLLTDETGTGALVFGTSPTFTTDITTPLIIGGSTVGSTIQYKGTTASGTSTVAAHQFLVGNNGATTAAQVFNSGQVSIGNYASPTNLRALTIGQDTSYMSFGSLVGATSYGAIYIDQATPSTSNYTITSDGLISALNASTIAYVRILNNNRITVSNTDQSFTPAAATSGAVTTFTFTKPNNTGQTASTAVNGVLYTLGNRQWATGAITTQKEFELSSPTYSFVGASTITSAYSFYVNPPVAGTNATISTAYAAGFNGRVRIEGIVNLGDGRIFSDSGMDLNAGSNSIRFFVGGAGVGTYTSTTFTATPSASTSGSVSNFTFTKPNNTGQGAGVGVIGFGFNTGSRQWATGTITNQYEVNISGPTYSFVGASTINNAYTLYVTQPTAGTNATITKNWALGLNGSIQMINNTTLSGIDSAGTSRDIITWSSGDNITLSGRPGVTDIYLNPTNGGIGLYVKAGGDGGIGVASPAARWHVIKTTEQLRVGYDTSNYYSTTVGSTGTVTFNAVGTGSKFVFSDNIELTQTVTTESVTSDTTVTIVINGVTYKLLAKA